MRAFAAIPVTCAWHKPEGVHSQSGRHLRCFGRRPRWYEGYSSFLPVLRELGLVTIFRDGNFSGPQSLFDEAGHIEDEGTHVKRLDKFLSELIWMSKVLRYGRTKLPI